MIKLIYPKFWSKNGLLSYLLLPFSQIYIILGMIRKFFAKPIRLPAFVICVGNATVGGAGKTQIVLWLANKFIKKKINFLVITKAYGSNLQDAKIVEKTDSPLEVGDESILINMYAPVLAAKNINSKLTQKLIAEINPDIIICDDGLQNPNFIKDFTILAIDPNRACGNNKIFPSGPLRESIKSALAKSDIVTMIGNDKCKNKVIMNNITESGKSLFYAKIKLENKLDLNKSYYAFTAIGNPAKFFKLLQTNNVIVKQTQSFPDHHNYTENEIKQIQITAQKNGYSLITTKKDFVKIRKDQDNNDNTRNNSKNKNNNNHNNNDHSNKNGQKDGHQNKCKNSQKIICANVTLNFDDEEKLLSLIYEKLQKTS